MEDAGNKRHHLGPDVRKKAYVVGEALVEGKHRLLVQCSILPANQPPLSGPVLHTMPKLVILELD